MQNLILPTLIMLAFLFGCESKQHGHQHAEHSAHAHQSANELMNERSFDELVEAFESEERDAWQRPDAVIELLGDLSGKTVADIGAGSGYFVFRMVPKAQKVIAIDIDSRFLDYMEGRKAALEPEIQDRLEIRESAADNPNLGAAEADIILIVNTYHHIEDRVNYFRNLRQYLTDSGKIIIIDFKEGELPAGPPPGHKLPLATILSELQAAGYGPPKVNSDLLEYQHIVQVP